METKIDTLKTHAQRAEFARKLYHPRIPFRRNAITALMLEKMTKGGK